MAQPIHGDESTRRIGSGVHAADRSAADDAIPRARIEEEFRFLAKASAALGDITDLEQTLERISRLAVPDFADWSEVTVSEPGGIRSITVNHWDEDRLRESQDLCRLYPREEHSGAVHVISTGESIFLPRLDDLVLRVVAVDERHLELLRGLGLISYICVPMAWKGEVKGALTYATAESGRHFDTIDLQVAQELGRRAAIALENAELMHQLREAARRKDEFMAMLAHELRNPLAPVRTAAEILRHVSPRSPQLEWTHDVIERQVRQMSRLVDDLLDASRIGTGKLTLRKERIDVAAAVRLALEASRTLVERGDHELVVELPPKPVWIEADLARLAQVISNLLNNAAKYTDAGGHIRLAVEQADGELVIRVSDNGMGIPKELLGRIFDMFEQGRARDGENSQGGLGIGLTLVRSLVEMHGGSVEARSPGPGLGSEFIVRMPLASQDARATPSAECPPVASGPTTRRILVVDDNRDAADSLCMLLASHGHRVQVAYDGLQAVESAKAFEPDVVLMDIGLPKLYGYEAARRIRQARGKGVLLVAVTGWGQDEDRRRAQEAGFDHHLTKPVDPEAIDRLLR